MVTETDYKKMLWHSRRGMLELDLLLLPFAQQVLPELADEQQRVYRRLLDEEDQDLFACLVDRVQHPEPQMQAMVDRIRAHAASNRA